MRKCLGVCVCVCGGEIKAILVIDAGFIIHM